MTNYTYKKLEVVGRELPGADQVEIGVDVDGAFFPLGSYKLQDFNATRAEAEKAAADAKQKSNDKSS